MPDRDETYHSEEVQEIMGRIPGWIIRWGVLVIFIIFFGIIIGCYFIKFPQTVMAQIVITTSNPPADLIARSTGKIDRLFVKEGDFVEPGDEIILLYSTADYGSIKQLYDSLIIAKEPERFVLSPWIRNEYNLGEIQSVYSEFRRRCLDYKFYIETGNIEKRQSLLKEQIRKNEEYYRKQTAQKEIIEKDIEYEKKNFSRDSALYAKEILSGAEFDKTAQTLLQKESSREGMVSALTAVELNILQQEQQLIELTIQKNNEISDFENQISGMRQQLVAQIDQWFYQYLVVSPIKGKVTLTSFWSENQTVQAGERVATVIPEGSGDVIGRMIIPSDGFGKVEPGQTVNVKLNGFPHMEYGMLKGSINNISTVPEGAGYIAEIVFPDELITTYNKKLDLIQQMDGTAEIITKDQRLIQRFLQPVRALFDK